MDVIKDFLKSRVRTIYDRDGKRPYMIRYYLFLKDRKWFPFNFTLHKICLSDEPTLHDHPWPWMSIILKGGYWEWTDNKKPKWKGPGRISFSSSKRLHRLQLGKDVWNNNIPCWTLFFMGPKRRDWGFKVKDKWINNEEYLSDRKKD